MRVQGKAAQRAKRIGPIGSKNRIRPANESLFAVSLISKLVHAKKVTFMSDFLSKFDAGELIGLMSADEIQMVIEAGSENPMKFCERY